jgi:signal transduction histidine kinase
MLNNQKLKAQEAGEIAKRSYESVEKLSTLVKDLLDVSRIEQKRIKIQKQSTRLERVIEQAIEGFQLQVQDKGIYLKFQKPEKLLPEVKVDPDRISEVLNNLIGNAIKFTEKGGITVSLTQKDGKALISVADTGIGINKDALPRLFQKFYQAQTASSVLSNERGGTGLGLYIAKNIVELHGGEIWVESERRKGTTFYFTLPL